MIKRNWKKMIIILVIMLVCSGAGAYAATTYLINADAVSYNSTDVKAALDDLRTKATSAPTYSFTQGQLVTYDGDGTDEQYYVLYEWDDTAEIITRYNLEKSATPTTQTKAAYGTTACAFSSSQYWGSTTRVKL